MSDSVRPAMREGWISSPLSDLVDVSTERLGAAEEPVIFTCTETQELVDQAKRFSKRLATDDTSAYKVVRPFDIVINPYLLWAGAIAQNQGKQTGITSPVYVILRPTNRVDARFIGLLMTSSRMRPRYDGISIGSIQRRRRVLLEALLDLPIDFPPLPEQRRIVDLIGAVDAQIEAADHAVERAERARRGLLSELLAPAMREGWRRVPLGEVVHVNPRDRALSPDAPFIPMDAVPVGGRWPAYTEPRGTRGGARAAAGDVLFPRITPCLENGKLAQVPSEVIACGGSTELIVLRAGSEADAGFVFALCSSSFFRRRAEALMTGSTGRQRVSGNDLGALEIDLPPLPEQRRIVDLIGAADSEIRALKAVADQARELRKGLLIDLLSGAHEIPASYDRLLAA